MAKQALADGLEGFQKLGIVEGLNFEFAARVCRLVGDYDEAGEYARKGIEISKEFPLYLAALYFELALTLKSDGKPFKEAAQKALELFGTCEAERRMKSVRIALGIN